MKELYQHINSNDSEWNPDIEMLQKYFSGELNASDHFKVEKQISLDEFDYKIGDLQGSESLGKIDWDELKTIANRNELDHSSKIGQAVAYTLLLLLLLLGIIAFLFFANTKPVNKQTNGIAFYSKLCTQRNSNERSN